MNSEEVRGESEECKKQNAKCRGSFASNYYKLHDTFTNRHLLFAGDWHLVSDVFFVNFNEFL